MRQQTTIWQDGKLTDTPSPEMVADALRDPIAGGTLEENAMSRGMAYLLYVVLGTPVDSCLPV